jgi:hypothetical protein
VVFSHSLNGLNHFRDRATKVGVMPFRERARWLCPIRLTVRYRSTRGIGCDRRVGRSRDRAGAGC